MDLILELPALDGISRYSRTLLLSDSGLLFAPIPMGAEALIPLRRPRDNFRRRCIPVALRVRVLQTLLTANAGGG